MNVKRGGRCLPVVVALGMLSLAAFGEPGDAGKRDLAARDARLARAVFRCTNLSELVACGDALNMKPNDPGLLLAEADALVRRQRPGEAIGVYRNVLTVSSDHAMVNARIAAADIERRSLVDACESREGQPGLQACEAAWLPNAPDEVNVIKRRAFLLQANNQPSAAFDMYLAAARLRPADRGVASAIVSLSAPPGRTDAVALAARGSALITLGRAGEALGPLRQALDLEPGLARAKSDLRLAQHRVTNARSAAAGAALRETAAADTESPGAANPAANAEMGDGRFSNAAPVTRSN